MSQPKYDDLLNNSSGAIVLHELQHGGQQICTNYDDVLLLGQAAL